MPSRSQKTSQQTTLDTVPRHKTVTVERVLGERPFRRRLMEMGLVPGTRVVSVNVAPLGDPMEISVRGGRLSIRRAEAAKVTVSP